MKCTVFITLTIILHSSFYGQVSKIHKSEVLHFSPAATVIVRDIKTDWDPQLQSMEMPPPGSESYRRYLIDLKEKLYGNYQPAGNSSNKTNDTAALSEPEILAGWEGNLMGTGVPNDNDMAISNDGNIISVINSSIYFYDETDSLYSTISLYAFSDTLGIIDSKFDPKVLYDPIFDRFIIIFLSGFEPDATNIILAFSQTNDPLGAWNLYALPGNPKNNDRWTDFPMFALTETELFLTINLIIPDEPWQTGFSESLIWQLSLNKGYTADSLDAVFYDSIYFGGNPIRNLDPVRGGETSHGPDMYFLSNRNFAPVNDTIFIVHVTGTLDDPSTEVEIDYSVADLNYGVPPQARQYPPHTFDTNDGRILGSFYEDGEIQFVSHTIDPSTGFCAIYHGLITDLDGDKSIHANIIGDDTLDLGYPNIAYTGKFDGDNQSIIVCDHTAPTVYAGMSAVFYNWGAYSGILDIKTGDTYVNVLSGAYERWGDYTGIQRKYNEPGSVWVSGNFGKYVDVFPFSSRNNATWIASLKSTVEPNVGNAEISNEGSANIYPNPSTNYFMADLNLPESGTVQFRIYDVNGRLVKYLLNAKGSQGLNRFSFSTEQLTTGTYFLDIQLNGNPFKQIEIIKQ